MAPTHILVRKKPMWVKYYPMAAYTTFTINLVVVFVYLTYIGLILNDRKLYIDYVWVIKFHTMNSYSLLSPFTAFPIIAVLSYHVKQRKNLIDGDFLGILAVVLIMAGISVYDATKLIYLNVDLRDIIKDHRGTGEKATLELYNVFDKSILRDGDLKDPVHQIQRTLQCCGIYNGSDDWIGIIQKTNAARKVAFPLTVPWSCCQGCESKVDCETCDVYDKTCPLPMWEYLIEINRGTCICMFTLSFVFLLTMTAYIFHWAAMQLDADKHQFDPKADPDMTLRFTSQDDIPVVLTRHLSTKSTNRQKRVAQFASSKEKTSTNKDKETTVETVFTIIVPPPRSITPEVISTPASDQKLPALSSGNIQPLIGQPEAPKPNHPGKVPAVVVHSPPQHPHHAAGAAKPGEKPGPSSPPNSSSTQENQDGKSKGGWGIW